MCQYTAETFHCGCQHNKFRYCPFALKNKLKPEECPRFRQEPDEFSDSHCMDCVKKSREFLESWQIPQLPTRGLVGRQAFNSPDNLQDSMFAARKRASTFAAQTEGLEALDEEEQDHDMMIDASQPPSSIRSIHELEGSFCEIQRPNPQESGDVPAAPKSGLLPAPSFLGEAPTLISRPTTTTTTTPTAPRRRLVTRVGDKFKRLVRRFSTSQIHRS
ncbi:hypothetical protein NHQ30_011166 [Ciborinia camelliae]|nr:hypothetical protein NHQ30_011166 [Ciborinia camelliae]